MISMASTKTKTVPFDPVKYIKGPEAAAAYLEEAFSTGNAAVITDALGVVARAKGMSEVAEAAGLGRESLYKALKKGANPKLETLLKVMQALGLRITTAVAHEEVRAS